MLERLRGAGRDLGGLRRVESHVVVILTVAFTVLSLLTDAVSEELRWTVVMAGLGLLVHRGTTAEDGPAADRLLADRRAFQEAPLAWRLREARELWVFAPSGAGVLSSEHCDVLRRHLLARERGTVRVVVLDPAAAEGVARRFSEGLEFSSRRFTQSLDAVIGRLEALARWPCRGEFGYRLLDHNPGFSLVAVDPGTHHGTLIVEFHGVHNESSSARMHLTLARSRSEHWYSYWTEQFEHIWRIAAEPSGSRRAG